MKFTSRDWVWLTICVVVAFSAITDSIRANKLRYQLDSLQVFTLSVQAIDQKTGRPIDGTVVGPHFNVDSGQIMRLWSSSATVSGSIHLEYIGIPPFAGTILVTNAGYEQKIVSFDSTNSTLSVYLMHKT